MNFNKCRENHTSRLWWMGNYCTNIVKTSLMAFFQIWNVINWTKLRKTCYKDHFYLVFLSNKDIKKITWYIFTHKRIAWLLPNKKIVRLLNSFSIRPKYTLHLHSIKHFYHYNKCRSLETTFIDVCALR